MKAQDFEYHSKEVLQHCWELLFSKAKEYASDEDRLANFKQPCSIMQSNPAETCLWYDMKHIASLAKMAKDLNQGVVPTKEMLMEKIGDYINYGLLFYGTVLEEMERREPRYPDYED